MTLHNKSVLLNKSTLASAMALIAIALIGTACSSSDTTSGHGDHGMNQSPARSSMATNAAHNQADIMFNQMMIPHHQQAVEMADLVASRTENRQLRSLATQVRNAQQPEIDQMTARLTSWGVGADGSMGSTASMAPMTGMDHGDMGGTMSDAQMTALRAASGAQFDKLWLNGMIAHHQGAVAMATTELANGVDTGSRELATRIKSAQQAEIDQMRTLLDQ